MGTLESRPGSGMPTAIVETDLTTGDNIAKLIDGLKIGPALIVVGLRNQTPEGHKINNLRISGTQIQLDIFKNALGVQKEAVKKGLTDLALDAEMRNFLSLQRIRYSL